MMFYEFIYEFGCTKVPDGRCYGANGFEETLIARLPAAGRASGPRAAAAGPGFPAPAGPKRVSWHCCLGQASRRS